jgi:hypothetical protein
MSLGEEAEKYKPSFQPLFDGAANFDGEVFDT